MLGKALQQAAGNAGEALYVDDVFSTYLYTGNGSTQTITNGIDLAGEGGIVWTKRRDTGNHVLYFHQNGGPQGAPNTRLYTNTGGRDLGNTNGINSYNSNGFTLGTNTDSNTNTADYVSWAFRTNPNFFNNGYYAGTGATKVINHGLGATPGLILVKQMSDNSDPTRDWVVWHRSLSANNTLYLNTTATQSSTGHITSVGSTSFTVSSSNYVNSSLDNYAWFAFAHNGGGFGLSGTDNVISCGTYTGNGGSESAQVNLGWEPQWVLIKNISGGASLDWWLFDSARGMTTLGNIDADLRPNSSQAEENAAAYISPNATGFTLGTASALNQSQTYIYVAIRRPMKPPSAGTSVFLPSISGTPNVTFSTGFNVDMFFTTIRSGWARQAAFIDRLRGATATLESSNTDGESTAISSSKLDISNGYYNSGVTAPLVSLAFARAPGFFDVVCYTGNGTSTPFNHNLTVAPEMLITKIRNSGTPNWGVWHSGLSDSSSMVFLNTTGTPGTGYINSISATQFSFATANGVVNTSGFNYVAYLFASRPGISKVGTYTGNGTNQTINCGFTSGARFVLIKRTDSTGDWYVWDSTRGIVSANDPHLSLNTTSAEVTTDDTIDPDSSGFIVNQVAATNVNVSSATYIYLAIA